MIFAVIKTNGYQFLVSSGEKIIVPARLSEVGKVVEFEKVLMIKDDGNIKFGRPFVKGAKVKGIVRRQGKLPKITVFKFKRRLKYRRKRGHRQDYSEIEITDIVKGKG